MRMFELFIGISAFPFIFLYFFVPESPRWLLAKGRVDEAIEVATLACQMNNMPVQNVEVIIFRILRLSYLCQDYI